MSDWWPAPSQTQPQSGPSGLNLGSTSSPVGRPFTPTRPLGFSTHTPALAHHRSTRFNIADELDPEDARMAENVRFAPSFAASPAGKLVMGQGGQMALSPQGATGAGGMGQSVGAAGSPPGGSVRAARSPTGRFAVGETAASPRDSRRKTMTHQLPDEDMPPTAGLRDAADSPARPMVHMSNSTELPTPPTLQPSSNTTTLLIFGPPANRLHTLEKYLSDIGPIKSYTPGPEGTNWWVVEYAQPISAAYCLRRHGDLISSKYLLGVRIADGLNTSAGGWGSSGTGGQSGGGMDVYRGNGPGRAMMVQKDKNVIRPPVVSGDNKQGGWEEPESQGFQGKMADWLFGR